MTCIQKSVWSIFKITGNYSDTKKDWFELFAMCIKIIHGYNTPRRILIHLEVAKIIHMDQNHFRLFSECISLSYRSYTLQFVEISHSDASFQGGSKMMPPPDFHGVVLFLIYLFRQGWWTSIQWFDWCLQKDIGHWWYPRSLQRFRHLCCWYFHLQRFLLRSLWLPQANPSPSWCWLPRLIHPRLQ